MPCTSAASPFQGLLNMSLDTVGVSKRDIESMLRGIELAVRAMVAAGASMVTLLNNGPSLEYHTADGGSIDVFMATIRKAGIVRNVTQVWAEQLIEHTILSQDA